ncbi:MAG: orotidine-5'-phosphate decarboxylase [Thermodesulfobacteriota bacterium]
MPEPPKLVVALDLPDAASALALAGGLPAECWAKVGLELFTAAGPEVVSGLAGTGRKVFLDLKFLDIPNTVRGAVRSAARLGAAMADVHLLGGVRMLAAALQGREDAAAEGFARPLLLGITVLTSMGPGDLPLPGAGDPADLVLDLARLAKAEGLDGVVCSGREVPAVKAACGRDFLCLTPGIRPEGEDAGDQRRTMTPAQAVAAGADYLVAGRPVTRAADPAAAARAILEQIRGARL